jgi:hypothetical protein
MSRRGSWPEKSTPGNHEHYEFNLVNLRTYGWTLNKLCPPRRAASYIRRYRSVREDPRGGASVEKEIVDLAVTGAKTLVSAMTTTGWNSAREGFIKLWRKHAAAQDAETIAGDLDETHSALVASDGARRQEAEPGAIAEWTARLAELLGQNSRAISDLQELVANTPRIQSGDNTQIQVSKFSLHGNFQVGPHGTVTITRTGVAGIALLLFVAILVVFLVLHPGTQPNPLSPSPQQETVGGGVKPNSCVNLPRIGVAESPGPSSSTIGSLIYKVTTGPGAVSHQILPGGYVQQAFVSSEGNISQVTAIIGSGDSRKHPIEFDLLSSDGKKVLFSATISQTSATNNADTAATIEPPIHVGHGTVLILRVVNKSSDTLGFYLNNPGGQLVPSPYSACLYKEQPNPSIHPDTSGWILAGSVTGTNGS